MKSIDKTAKSIGAFDSINYGVYCSSLSMHSISHRNHKVFKESFKWKVNLQMWTALHTWYSSLRRSDTACVNDGSHSFVCHTYVQSTNGMSHNCPYSPATQHHRILASTHFPSHWRQKAQTAWVAHCTPRRYTCEWSPIPVLTGLNVE